jgi:hypothetical protein
MPSEFMNNENRTRLADSINKPTPATADGGPIGATSPGEMGPGILGAPLNPDPHRHGRHSNNLSVKPGEKPGSHYADENRRRIFGRDVKYR